MNMKENYIQILKLMNVKVEEKTLRNNANKNTILFPFNSRKEYRARFNNEFYSILGEFSRILLNKKLNNTPSIPSTLNQIKSNKDNYFDIEEGSEEYLEKLIKEYLFNRKGELKISNPHLFLYLPLSNDKHSNGEKEIALFLRDVFFRDNDNLKEFFETKESDNLIIKLILNNIPKLYENETPYKYKCYLDNIKNVFNEDINFITNYKEYFIENINKIFAYYYFFYISQLILKINRGFDDNKEIDNLYYLLDWESASKNRKTINKGYKFLKDKTSSLYAQLSLIDQINTLLGTSGLLEKDLLNQFNQLSNENQNEVIKYLKKWISLYKLYSKFDDEKNSQEEYLEELPNNFKDLVNELYKSLNNKKHGIDAAQKSRYAQNLEDMAKKFFLKRRGSYGYILNLNRNMLLIMTALCVKDKKIRLNQLFEEYERRGLFFDRYSKEEIIKLLTKLNLIDKKSDSGDAQYVKPIL